MPCERRNKLKGVPPCVPHAPSNRVIAGVGLLFTDVRGQTRSLIVPKVCRFVGQHGRVRNACNQQLVSSSQISIPTPPAKIPLGDEQRRHLVTF
jgi:hypothetical protein